MKHTLLSIRTQFKLTARLRNQHLHVTSHSLGTGFAINLEGVLELFFSWQVLLNSAMEKRKLFIICKVFIGSLFYAFQKLKLYLSEIKYKIFSSPLKETPYTLAIVFHSLKPLATTNLLFISIGFLFWAFNISGLIQRVVSCD